MLIAQRLSDIEKGELSLVDDTELQTVITLEFVAETPSTESLDRNGTAGETTQSGSNQGTGSQPTGSQDTQNLNGSNISSIANNSTSTVKNNELMSSIGSDEATAMIGFYYDELVSLLTAAGELIESSPGRISTHLEMMNGAWIELRTGVYQAKSRGIEVNINFNAIMKRYIQIKGELNDSLSIVKNSDQSNIQFSLPKLKLPEFNGEPTEWQPFISLFDRMVHENKKLDKELKVEYLKTCVKGDAAKITKHMDPTEENYQSCYELLRKRFDNKREMLGKLIDKMMELPKIKVECANNLKNLHDTIYESIMSIKNIGVSISNWDSLLTHILTRNWIRQRWLQIDIII